MAASDVRVTLTADDQATEIVRKLAGAVKQLDAQQRTSNAGLKDAASASRSATGAFNDFQKAIGAVAAALGAIRVLDFVRETIQATDEIGKLSLKTGATTEALSVLSVAASTADLSQQELANGLKFLARSFTELQQGVPQTAAAFQALGLSARDLRGLSLDQVLVRIADAQAKFGDGAGKTAALLKIFGRSGGELIPLLHDLANGGFDAARKKAEDFGLVISEKDAKAAQEFDDRMRDLKSRLEGVVLQLSPLIDLATGLADAIGKFVSAHPALAAFAAAATIAAAGITVLSVAVGGLAVAVGALDVSLAPVLVTLAALVVLAGGVGLIAEAIHKARLEAEGFAKASKDAAGQNKALPQVVLPDPAQQKALLEAQIAAAKQAAQDELAAQKAGLDQSQELNNEFFANGLSGLADYYDQRKRLTQQGIDAEIKALQDEHDRLAVAPLPEQTAAAQVKRTAELKSLLDQIDIARIKGQTQVNQLTQQELEARRRIADQVRGFQAQILTAQGQVFAAAQIQITKQVNDFMLALQQEGGHTTEEIQKQAGQLERLLTIQARFAAAQNRANQETTSLDLARAEVQNKVAQGLLSERDGQLQIAAIERQRLPTLENLADQMDKFAADANNPELRLAAEQFRASFQGIGKVIDESTKKLANLKGTIFASVQSDLSEFLGNTISHVNSLAEAFGALAQSIAESFQRVIGDIIASKAIEAIRNLFEHPVPAPVQDVAQVASSAGNERAGTAMSAASVGMVTAGKEMTAAAATMLIAAHEMAAAAGAVAFNSAANLNFLVGGFATGGSVKGPGTGTSDSILARLSAGEYVLRADAVRRLGIPFLDTLNGLRTSSLRRFSAGLPGFATGGLVSGGGSGGSFSGEIGVTVAADEGSVLKAFSTRGGFKATLKHVNQNPQAFRAALGIP